MLLFTMGFVIRPCAWSASPCGCVDRALTEKNKAEWATAVAKQLHAQKVDVLQSFRFGDWRIVYVDSHLGDEAFLFFSHDPLRSHYVTMWSGAAVRNENEERSIKAWTLKNAPGIPEKLAGCFAWYVTNARTM